MFLFKRFSILMIALLIAIPAVFAQSNSEMTVEQSYLQDSIEIMIIRETARATSRDQKLVALQFIGDAIDRGNRNDEIRQTLEFLSMEGTRSVARENGRVVNNFPEVRMEAARFLGKVGTEEARKTLVDICLFETEPMVLQEAITSLGEIVAADSNETIRIIASVVSRFDNLNPDNLVALATIDAFEKIAKRNNGLNSREAISLLQRISEGHYIRPVQERARDLLSDLRNFR